MVVVGMWWQGLSWRHFSTARCPKWLSLGAGTTSRRHLQISHNDCALGAEAEIPGCPNGTWTAQYPGESFCPRCHWLPIEKHWDR